MNEPSFWGLDNVAWTAIYTLLTAALLLVAVVAGLYARSQVKAVRDQNADARRSQQEASRPYVLVSAEPSQASRKLFDLVVRNIGVRPAFEVSIAMDPAPLRANETPGHEIAAAKMLNEPIRMVAPRQELRAFFDSHVDRNGRGDLPSTHEVTLRYSDSAGRAYEERSTLDLEAMRGTMYTSVYTLHDVGKALDEIRKVMQGASLLQRRGRLDVDAEHESRRRKRRRLRREGAAAKLGHAEMIQRLRHRLV